MALVGTYFVVTKSWLLQVQVNTVQRRHIICVASIQAIGIPIKKKKKQHEKSQVAPFSVSFLQDISYIIEDVSTIDFNLE